MKIKDITQYLESIAPSIYQESYDNSGLIVGHPETEVTGVLICLDSVEDIVEEAKEKGCNLVIAHHPIVFKGLRTFTGRNYVERTVIKAIKNDIAVYAIHTNLDNVYTGVNAKIAEKIGLVDTRILLPKKKFIHPNDSIPKVGSGMIGELKEPMKEMDFLAYLKETMQVGCVKYTKLLGKDINTVAVCGGSGGFLLNPAKAAKADIFITADYKYHEFFDADGDIIIADIGHYESEQFTIDLLHEILTEKFTTFAVLKTNLNTNPVNYL